MKQLFVSIIMLFAINIAAMDSLESSPFYIASRVYVLKVSPHHKIYTDAIVRDDVNAFANIDKNIQGDLRLESGAFIIDEDKVHYFKSDFWPQYDCIPNVKCSVLFKKLLMLSAMAGASQTFEYLMGRFYMPFPSLDKPIPEYDFLNKWIGRCVGYGGDFKMLEFLPQKGLINPKNIDDIWIGAATGNNVKILQWLFIRCKFSKEAEKEIFCRLAHYARDINKGLATDLLAMMDLKSLRYELIFGGIPIHLALFYAHDVIMEILFKDGTEIDTPDGQGETPLFYAIRNGNLRWVERLVHAGVNVNARNALNGTPLHIAALLGDTYSIQLLLSKGADPSAQSDFGRYPRDLAMEMMRNARSDIEKYQQTLKLLPDNSPTAEKKK